MDDLLKEAIADAKVVRDTAVENARLALAEAFTPKIQSMLTQKIRQEVEDENQEDEMKDEAMDDEVEDEGEEKKEGYGDEGEHEDEGEEVKEIEDEVEDEGEEVEEVHDEVEDEDDEVEEGEHEDEGEHDDEDDDLDLESILRELEKEVEDEDDEVEEVSHADEDEELEEELKSSDVGAADNKLDKDAESSSDIGKADKAKHTEGVEDEVEDEGEHDDEEVDEDIDLEEILKALSEVEDEDEEVEENVEEITQLKSELEEYRNAVKYMRGKLNEVNLLNAKLLFTNKLFRAFGLSEGDKYRVVETFDRAKNLREVKLVYATLAESFGQKPKIQESKGKSSKPVASTKPKNESKVISEGTDLKNRFKKLANII